MRKVLHWRANPYHPLSHRRAPYRRLVPLAAGGNGTADRGVRSLTHVLTACARGATLPAAGPVQPATRILEFWRSASVNAVKEIWQRISFEQLIKEVVKRGFGSVEGQR